MNLDDYERIPGDTYEYGRTVLRRIGADDELIDTIDGYMDFEKLGEDTTAVSSFPCVRTGTKTWCLVRLQHLRL